VTSVDLVLKPRPVRLSPEIAANVPTKFSVDG
jgi:hypothetical protein